MMNDDSKNYELNDGHILEAADRLHVACVYIDEFLMQHPLINSVPEFQNEIDKAIIILSDLYQKISGLDTAEELTKKYKNQVMTEFDYIRSRQRALMPETMKKFEIELKSKSRPDSMSLPKYEFVYSWVKMIDPDYCDHIDNSLLKYNIRLLETAFEWTLSNFAELDLGWNRRWYSVLIDVLKSIKKEEWDKHHQDIVLNKYLTDARWYDY